MQIEVLLSVFFIFCLAILVGLVLYLVGWAIGAKGKRSAGKFVAYACGENLPSRKLQVNVERFLIFAIYFLVFDILAFILATSLTTPGYFPAIYALIVLTAIVTLLPLLRRD